MDKHKTVAELEYINDLIQRWKNAPDDEAMDALINLRNAVERAYNDYMISEKMYNDYNDLFQDHIGHYIDNNELLESLEKKTNENINIVEQADDKIAKSLDLGERADDDSEHSVDSKTDLQYIKDVMDKYWHERDEKEGVLSAVDKFTEIGNAIKKALEEKKISRMTAVELMEPLREIKDNMCDINKENAALDRFEEILDKKLAREDERGSQDQQQDQQYSNTGSGLGNALDMLARGLNRVGQKLDERAKATKENDRQQEKVGQKEQTQEQALKKIASLIDRYENAYRKHGSLLDPETAAAWRELTAGIKDVIENKLIPDDMAAQLRDTHDFLKRNSLNSKIQYDGIDELRQIIGVSKEHVEPKTNTQARNAEIGKGFYMGQERSAEPTHKSDLGKNQRAEDAPQIQPKSEDLMQREDDANTEMQSKEQPLKRITDLVNKYEKIYREKGSALDDDVSAVWKELTDGINYAVENKLISEDVAAQLIDAHNFLRGHALNSEKQFEGINKFKQIIGEQSKQSMQEPQVRAEEKIIEPKQPQEEVKTASVPETPHDTVDSKKQEKKDVAQEKSDLKPKSDADVKQQTEVREGMVNRKDARPDNVDEKDKAAKIDVQHRIDNFTNGNQKVLDMDNKREDSRKELNQAALAAYRRRVLEGRGTSNV